MLEILHLRFFLHWRTNYNTKIKFHFFIYFICNGVLDQEPYVKCEILAKNLLRDRNIYDFMICPSTNYVETSEWWKKKTCQTNKSIEKLVNNKLVFSQYHLWMDHDHINSQKPIYWWNAVQLKKLLTFSKGKNMVSATLSLQCHLHYWAQHQQEWQASVFPIPSLDGSRLH